MIKFIRFGLIILLSGLALFWFLTSPFAFEIFRGAEIGNSAKTVRDLENGKTLFAVGGCASCHMSPNQADRNRLGGGLALKTKFGTFYPPNISSDTQDGIGAWSEADFIRAMREGISPEGLHYYPAFPYPSYRHMTSDDLADLFAYLKLQLAVKGKTPDHALEFPFTLRRGLGLWKFAFLDGSVMQAKGSSVERGRYLVEGPGHCGECHSPRNLAGAVRKDLKLSGGPDAEGRGWVSNITPHENGLATWSRDEIAELLKSGFNPDYDAVGGAMADVVKNTSQISDEDRLAIADYLKSITPLAGLPRPSKSQPQ